ncbi:MAG TPA: hypothetical protein VE258_09410 [Ktedonobacterales bacterium]|nr:hypothetical protein [Ktedonobacterales bacterium]
MPVSKWPSDANQWTTASGALPAGQATDALAAARSSVLHEAKRLLGELQEVTSGLGDAFVGAGFARGAWRSPDAMLPMRGDQLPTVPLGALLARLAAFAAETGPRWLMGDAAALDEFAHEVRTLAEAIRTLRVLAQQQRLTPFSARGRRPLEHALADVRVEAQLDRLALILRRLTELASLPPASLAAWSEHALAPRDPGNLPAEPEQDATGAPEWLVRLRGRREKAPIAPDALPDRGKVPRRLLQGMRRPSRARVLALGSAAVLLVSGALALALMHGRLPPAGGAKSPTNAQATATATPSPTQTAAPPTPVLVPAHLAVSPASVTLPCSGASVTLTVSDTGGQALTWHASLSGSAVLSATSGDVSPHSSGTVGVHASGGQHGSGTIVFTTDGGRDTVSYKVSCH